MGCSRDTGFSWCCSQGAVTQSLKLSMEIILQKIIVPGVTCESFNPSKRTTLCESTRRAVPRCSSVLLYSTDSPVSFLQYNKHLFVHIGHANHSYSDPLLESVDIRQIYDKFPEKKGGLKELFGKGPQNAFFLVKFWVSKPWCGEPLLSIRLVFSS